MTVALVTDSTACIPSFRLQAGGIFVVPVQVVIDDESFDEGAGVSANTVVQAITNLQNVSTSRPSPARFEELYRSLQEQGYSEIVSVHLSEALSGTYGAAVLAANAVDIPVQVLNSRTVGLGLGFAVLAAAKAARAGADIQSTYAVAIQMANESRTWVVVESFDQLRKGGRVSIPQAAIGAALAVKPILQVIDGQVVPIGKVRTSSKAQDHIVGLAVEYARTHSTPVQVGLQHAGVPERAAAIATKLGRELPGVPITTTDLGAVLTAHIGPGGVAITVAPAPLF